MRDPYTIVRRPLITEKSVNLAAVGKYVFEVEINANKIEISEAINKIFKVDVANVNTLRVKGKTKRVGRNPQGRSAAWKKAYVTLKPGQRIEIFEGA